LTAIESVSARDVYGGTAPRRVAEQLAAVQTALGTTRDDIRGLLAEQDALMMSPQTAAT
jgi:hypothetical protein